ncbi:MAG: hypothetical protein ACK4E2_08665 [Pseudothermotoga sp.]
MSLFETFQIIGRIVSLGVFLVERPKDGAKKKEEVKKMVFDFMDDFNIRLPIPDIVLSYVLDFMIDNLVDFLNETLWKKKAA